MRGLDDVVTVCETPARSDDNYKGVIFCPDEVETGIESYFQLVLAMTEPAKLQQLQGNHCFCSDEVDMQSFHLVLTRHAKLQQEH